MSRIFYVFKSLIGKNPLGKSRFHSLLVSHITLYYVNVVSLVGVGNVVCFSKQRDRSGAVSKKIKNKGQRECTSQWPTGLFKVVAGA